MLLSGGPVSLTTLVGGIAGTSGILPLSGQLLELNASTSSGDQARQRVTQVFPRDATLTSITGRFVTTTALALVGSTITVEAQLFLASTPGGTPVAVPGAICTVIPDLTGIISIGTTLTCNVTGLAIPVTAQSTGYIEVRATAAGLALLNTVTLDAAVSLELD